VRNTGQRKNQNARDSDPKPKNKKRTSKRGTKLKGVPKGGELGTLFEEVEEVPQSLQLLTAKELKNYRDMSSHRNSAATGTNYWEGKVVEAVGADEGDTTTDDLKVGHWTEGSGPEHQ
jgi:hypothetical protein